MRKIVLTSHINMSGTGARVMLGGRLLADIYRANGAWQTMSGIGTKIMPPIPHSPVDAKGNPLRNERGRIVEVKLGAVINTLRETLSAKLNKGTPA